MWMLPSDIHILSDVAPKEAAEDCIANIFTLNIFIELEYDICTQTEDGRYLWVIPLLLQIVPACIAITTGAYDSLK